jgi:hypothetical protein
MDIPDKRTILAASRSFFDEQAFVRQGYYFVSRGVGGRRTEIVRPTNTVRQDCG